MINKILELTQRDLLIIIGDFLFDCDKFDEYTERLLEARCRIKLIMGNHDSKKLYNIPKFEIQLPLYSYKNMWISHAPIHPQELRNRLGNIHGHLHLEHVQRYIPQGHTFKIEKDNRYFNVNIDTNDYKFVPVETIKLRLEENRG